MTKAGVIRFPVQPRLVPADRVARRLGVTLAACIECTPTHTFGKGWACFKCGQSCQPPRLYKEWAERMAEIEGDADPTTGLPPNRATCKHEYNCVYEGWEDETYECSLCGDRYKLYDEDMK